MLFLVLACTSSVTEDTVVDSQVQSPVAIVVEDAWVDSLLGFWLGPADPTPHGRIDSFPMDFQVQSDGSVFSTTEAGRDGDRIELRFVKDSSGGWTLVELAQLEGVTQSYTTQPVAQDGQVITWVTFDDPEFLAIHVSPGTDTLDIEITLRGAQHVVFDLEKTGK
jgi:hypothetical protein